MTTIANNVLGLKASLDRLQMDYVDIVFANKTDPHTPVEGMHL